MTGPGVTAHEADVLLREARSWAAEGLLASDQLATLEARYGGLAAAAEAPPARHGFGQKALLALGVFVLGVAVLFTVSVFWGDLTLRARLFILLAIAALLAAAGAILRRREGTRGLGHGLLAVGAALVPIACAMALEAYEARAARSVFGVVAMAAPAALLVAGHRWSGPLAFVAYAAFLGGVMVALGLWGVEDERAMVTLADTILTVATLALLTLHLLENPTRSRWYEWALGANALAAVPLLLATLEVFQVRVFGDYTGIALLALLGALFFGIGLARRTLPPAVAGALLLAGDALWLGGEFGDTLGVVVVLFAEAALLIAAGQTLGWAGLRDRFGRRPQAPPPPRPTKTS